MSNGFATSEEGLDIAMFHQLGYKLGDNQSELTPVQKVFLRFSLEELMNRQRGGQPAQDTQTLKDKVAARQRGNP